MNGQFTVTDINLVLNIGTAVLVVVALAASYRTVRHRQNDAEMTRELAIWREKSDRLDDEVAGLETRLETQGIELREQAEACVTKVAYLEGQIDAIKQERDTMRQMVMLDKVPPALTELAHQTSQTVLEALHPIAQGIDRLLTKNQEEV